MADLYEYIEATDCAEEKVLLKKQWDDAWKESAIRCAKCDLPRHLMLAFRCLYCGLWFCGNCAEQHFGKTFAEYRSDTLPSNMKE